MKVYLASSGSYSDYGVTAIFLNREDAEKVSDNEVEEMEVYESLPEPTTGWAIEALPYTAVPCERFIQEYPWSAWNKPGPRPRTDTWIYGYRKANGKYLEAVRVVGQDKEQVRKAFYDKVAQLKAEDAGIA